MNIQEVKKAARVLRREGIPDDLAMRMHNQGPHIHPRHLRDVEKPVLKTFIKKK